MISDNFFFLSMMESASALQNELNSIAQAYGENSDIVNRLNDFARVAVCHIDNMVEQITIAADESDSKKEFAEKIEKVFEYRIEKFPVNYED